ncbi:ATP-binding protein [Streptomyces puniciscabiei]|uniref:ATP-binding protein n=1 Tax=Streptomyces puniciscabiei TaxID=164348 RepID=UPI003331E576
MRHLVRHLVRVAARPEPTSRAEPTARPDRPPPGRQRRSRGDPPSRSVAVCAMRAERRSAALARSFTAAQLSRWHVGDEVADAARIVVSELVTNAVLHSGATGVTLRLDCTVEKIVVRVQDDGVWRERTTAYHYDPAAQLAESGRGLHLVHAHTTACGVQRTPVGSCAWACLPRSRSEQ